MYLPRARYREGGCRCGISCCGKQGRSRTASSRISPLCLRTERCSAASSEKRIRLPGSSPDDDGVTARILRVGTPALSYHTIWQAERKRAVLTRNLAAPKLSVPSLFDWMEVSRRLLFRQLRCGGSPRPRGDDARAVLVRRAGACLCGDAARGCALSVHCRGGRQHAAQSLAVCVHEPVELIAFGARQGADTGGTDAELFGAPGHGERFPVLRLTNAVGSGYNKR